MPYIEDFRKAIPENEQSFPPYLFTMMDLARKADSEISELSAKNSDLEKALEEVRAELTTAQQVNMDALLSPVEINSSTTVEETNDEATIPTIAEIVDGIENDEIVII